MISVTMTVRLGSGMNDVSCSTWLVLSLLNQLQDDVASARDTADLGDAGTDRSVIFDVFR